MAVDSSARQPKNIQITQENFERFLGWLDADRDRAGERYEEIRHQLIKIFTSRGCLVPEELADECINRVFKRINDIIDQYQGDPAIYFYGVAKMVYLEYLRVQPIRPPQPVASGPEEAELKHECLERCMASLTHKNRELILAYYGEENQTKTEHRKVLAERMGMEPNALWVRVHRIREKLKACVSECIKLRLDH